jgi:myo-inositol-1(or 4)-monophosphatase
MGSAALDLAYVAAGRFDAFWERGLQPWDIAAGSLLITEAGGTLTAADGSPFTLAGGTVLCANADLHPRVLERLKAAG